MINDAFDLIEMVKRAELKIINQVPKNAYQVASKEAYLAQVRGILAGLNEYGLQFFEREVQREYMQGVEDFERSTGISFGLVDPGTLRIFIDDATSQYRSTLSNAYANVERDLSVLTRETRQRVLLETGSTLITGGTRKELSQKLKDIFKEKGITGLTYTTQPSEKNPNGIQVNMSLGAYTKGLALRTMRNSRIAAIVERSLQAGIDLVKFSAHPKPSPMCAPWQGQIVSITGKTEGYKTLEQAMYWYNGIGIVNHTYCRHTILPYVDNMGLEFK